MANTLGDLKTRIIAETARDDLGTGGESEALLDLYISRAIEHYSDQSFWFNRDSGTVSTTTGESSVVRPYAVRLVDTLMLGDTALQKAGFSAPSGSGSPSSWAEYGELIQLYPTPDGAYDLTVYGTAQIDAPEADTDITVWTSEAQDLIAARVKFLLFRDVFRDVEGTQLAAQAEGEAYSRLMRETRKRGVTSLRSNGDEPWSARTFNIITG